MQRFLSNSLANPCLFSNFALSATVTNNTLECQLKTRYYKLMPGLSFGLGAVAGSLTRLRRAVLCLFLSVIKNQRHMLTSQELTAHLERITRLHQQVLTQLQDKGHYQPKKGLVIPFPVGVNRKEVANG